MDVTEMMGGADGRGPNGKVEDVEVTASDT